MKKLVFNRNGIALIMTLSLLIILTLLVIGFATLMRTERQAARHYDREVAAQQMAHAGVMRVLATLKATIPATLDNVRFYYSAPGRVIGVSSLTGYSATLGFLYSTEGTATVPHNSFSWLSQFATCTPANMVDLSAFDIGSSAPIIPPNDFYIPTGTSTPAMAMNFPGGTLAMALAAAWIPVRSPEGHLIGRFAYWTDDNACRVNINTAYCRSTPSLGGFINTSSVDLRAGASGPIGRMYAISSELAYNIYSKAPYATIEHVKLVQGMAEDFYEANKFYLTNLSSETETDAFNRDRLNINTLTMTPGASSDYICLPLRVRLSSSYHIQDTPSGNWGLIFPNAVAGDGFLSKYAEGGAIDMSGAQFMCNLIDFTKPRNTPASMVGLFGDGPNAKLPKNSSGSNLGPLGLKKSPYINEVLFKAGVHGEFDSTIYGPFYVEDKCRATIQWRIDFEIINPYHEPLGEGYVLYYDVLVSGVSGVGGYEFNYSRQGSLTLAAVPAHSYGSLTIEVTEPEENWDELAMWTEKFPGVEYIRLKINQLRLLANEGTLTPSNDYSIRDYLAGTTYNSIVPPGQRHMDIIFDEGYDYTAPLPNYDESKTKAISKDDPRVPTVWRAGLPPTWLADNASLSWESPYNDGSDTGSVLHHSTFFIPEGPLPSLGLLGYLHTGKPWRTLRLGPQGTNTQVPDWALLDIFKLTDATLTTGKININAGIMQASTFSSPLRRAPISAILRSPSGSAIPGDNQGSITDAIISYNGGSFDWRGPGSGSSSFVRGSFSFVPTACALAGEICEIPALANNATTDAGREEVFRQIAPLITTRSNAFTVYSIGQSILDVNRDGTFTPGVDIITGEARVQAVVEVITNRNSITNSATTSYRINYFRHLAD